MKYEPEYVYVVHGFGDVHAFTTRRAARMWKRKFASKCEITKAPIHTENVVDAVIAITERAEEKQ